MQLMFMLEKGCLYNVNNIKSQSISYLKYKVMCSIQVEQLLETYSDC